MKKINPNVKIILTVAIICFMAIIILLPSIVHANTLHQDLTYSSTSHGWIFTIWKMMLGLANVFVVFVLLFLAVVNILHINYDTYTVKKSLPLLIGGIIAANFSLLICRMIVDAASVITITFAGNAQQLAEGYLCAFKIDPVRGWNIMSTITSNSLSYAVIIFLGIAMLIAVLIMAFLLWIRKTVIFLLVAIAPVAFILYAFPLTQGLFKQWWNQFIKWVFMGPILMAVIWFGSQIGSNQCNSPTFDIGIALTVIGITYLAAMVPFKMGGAIMGAWGNLGQKVTGTGKEGYLRKPADKWIGDKKDAAKLRANNWFNKNTALGKWRAGHELEMETLKGENESILKKRQADVRNKLGSKQQLRDAEIANSTSILEEEKTKQQLDIESGNFNHISKRQLQQITGKSDPMDVAQKYIEQANKLKQVQEGLDKRRSLDLINLSERDGREEDALEVQSKQLEANGIKVESDYDEEGIKMAPNQKNEVHYVRALQISEELRLRAKSETDLSRREELIKAADQYYQKAKELESNNQTVEIKNPTTGQIIRTENVKYNAYLGRNLSGRRQKVINPQVNDEAEVQVLSSTHTGLVDDTIEYQKDASGNYIIDLNTGKRIRDISKKKTFGTSEFRGTDKDYDKAVNGNWHEIDETAAFAVMVQLRAQRKVMDHAKQGDIEGLETMDLFLKRIEEAGRANYQQTTAKDALDKMGEKNLAAIYRSVTPNSKKGDWERLSDSEKTTFKQDFASKLDLSKLDVTSRGPEASANKILIGRMLAEMDQDKFLGFSSSPGSVLRKTTPMKK